MLQDTFVLVLRKADTASGESFRGWLFAVAHQQALLFRRKGKARARRHPTDGLLELVGAAADPSAAADTRETAEVVAGCSPSCPRRNRT